MIRRTTLAFGLAFLAFACDNDPAEGKTKVEAKEVAADAVVEKVEATDEQVALAFDESAGSLKFVGAKVTAKHPGEFKKFKGTYFVVDGKPEASRVEVEIDVASLAIEPEKLQGHLLSEDFFGAEKFPSAKFVSTKIEKGGKEGATHTVTGQLTLHGKTQEISFPAQLSTSKTSGSAQAEFAINRKDFGIVYPGMPDDLIKDDVLIQIDLTAKK